VLNRAAALASLKGDVKITASIPHDPPPVPAGTSGNGVVD